MSALFPNVSTLDPKPTSLENKFFKNSSSVEKLTVKKSLQSDSTLENKSPKYSFKCYVCNANFADNPKLKMYLASAVDEKTQFKCNICWVRARHFCAPSN